MRGGAYARGTYTWSNTSVKEKVGLSAEGPIAGGGGAYRRNTVIKKNNPISKVYIRPRLATSAV